MAFSELAAANRKPHIDRVFGVLTALADMAVFGKHEAMDAHLDSMQQRVRGS